MHAKQLYKDYCKPKLAELLSALKLDLEYTAAQGNYLFTRDNRQVVDFIGGFGTTLLGHNHPELIAEMMTALQENIPSHAQASVRGESACLAERLNQLLPAEKDYYVNFSNSGAESVEAAIKHAYKVQFDKVRREYERISKTLNDFYYQVESQHLDIALPGKNKELTDFRDDLEEYNLAQFELFQNKPVMIAFKGSFHGKTTSSLKVTFNKSYREAFEGLSAISTVYIDPDRPERLPEIITEQVCTFYYPIIENSQVILRPVTITRVMGLIMEIVMGEGGIRPFPEQTLSYLAEQHTQLKVPYLIDEIQTGCGRLGSFFGYTNTALKNVEPEYLMLSKALGGGLVKIGATLIRQDIYDQDFGILHTSTFSDDELSARVALKFIACLTENDNALMSRITAKGSHIISRLKELQTNYPSIIKDVRGSGLMIGLEFTDLQERSPFFRASGKQGVLSLLISSYLLQYHGIRLIAPLTTILKGNPGKQRLSILRIQPPVTITDTDIDALVIGLQEVIEIIQRNNEYCLIAHLTGTVLDKKERIDPRRFPACWPVVTQQSHIDARTGFVVHPTHIDNLAEYYFPSFNAYNSDISGLKSWWNEISRFLEPVHVRSSCVTSNDYILENNMVFVPYLPEYFTNHKEPWLVREMEDKVQDAVTIAKELGDDNIPVSIVGLGAYTSIITKNGLTVNDYEMPVTTGNAYTTALTILGIMHAAEQQDLDLSRSRVAIVGATGNIGTVVAQILALNVGEITLVTRQDKQNSFRLKRVRQTCWNEILRVMQKERKQGIPYCETQLSGLAARLYAVLENAQSSTTESVAKIHALLEQKEIPTNAGALIDALFEKELKTSATGISLQMGVVDLQDCDVVIVATNSSDSKLITPEMVKPGAIVCCASVPSNLSDSFVQVLQRNVAFDGGLARLPENSAIDFVGMPRGQLTYGCLAETLVLGFEGQNHSFCKGTLTTDKVYQVMEMADNHGFALGNLKLNDLILDNLDCESAVA